MAEATRIMQKYPNSVPVIISASTPIGKRLDKRKFLCPRDITFGQFLTVVRSRLRLTSEDALFGFLTNNKIPNIGDCIGTLYDLHHNNDRMLHLSITEETTFGHN